MSERYSISFYNPDSAARVIVNGILVFSEEDPGRSVSRASPFLKSDRNLIELVSIVPGRPATVVIRDVIDGDPELAPILLTLTTEAGLPDQIAKSEFGYIDIKSYDKEFKWLYATEIEDIENQVSEIYSILKQLSAALENGPNSTLVKLLNHKHIEIADSLGLSIDEMNEGLADGLSARRINPGFGVELVEPELFLPSLSSDRKIVNVLRKNGGHAIKIMDGRRNPGFSVSMAKIDGSWTVIR